MLMPNNETQAKIVSTLRQVNRPLTVSQIAQESGLSIQTIHNHKEALVLSGFIRPTAMLGVRGTVYECTDGGTSSLFLVINNQMTPLSDILRDAAKKGLPNNPIERNLVAIIVRLYQMSAYNLDDDNPQPILNNELKGLQNILYSAKRELTRLTQFAESLERLQYIWDPKTMPKALIMNDPSLGIEETITMCDRIEQGANRNDDATSD